MPPLVLGIAVLALMRWSRIRLRAPTVLAAIAAGLILDPITDAFSVSFLTTLSILTLVSAIVALRRTAPH